MTIYVFPGQVGCRGDVFGLSGVMSIYRRLYGRFSGRDAKRPHVSLWPHRLAQQWEIFATSHTGI